jgi:hypothetical protein
MLFICFATERKRNSHFTIGYATVLSTRYQRVDTLGVWHIQEEESFFSESVPSPAKYNPPAQAFTASCRQIFAEIFV